MRQAMPLSSFIRSLMQVLLMCAYVTKVNGTGLLITIGSGDPQKCETLGDAMDVQLGNIGGVQQPNLLIGGNTKSRSWAYPLSSSTACLTKPVAFFRKYTVAHGTGASSQSHELIFTEQVVVNSTLGYFSGVSAVKWEYTNMAKNVDWFAITVQISDSGTDAVLGNIVIIFYESTNIIKKSYFLHQSHVRPDPSYIYLIDLNNYYKDIHLNMALTRKSVDQSISTFKPAILSYVNQSNRNNVNFVNTLEWSFQSKVGITAYYRDIDHECISAGNHGNSTPTNSVELLVSIELLDGTQLSAAVNHNFYETSMNLIVKFMVDHYSVSTLAWSITAVGMPFDKDGLVPLTIDRAGFQKMTLYKFFKSIDCPAGCFNAQVFGFDMTFNHQTQFFSRVHEIQFDSSFPHALVTISSTLEGLDKIGSSTNFIAAVPFYHNIACENSTHAFYYNGSTSGSKVYIQGGYPLDGINNFMVISSPVVNHKIFGGTCASLNTTNPCTVKAVRRGIITSSLKYVYMANTASKFEQTVSQTSDSLTGKITTSGTGSVALTNGGSQSIVVSGTIKTSVESELYTRADASKVSIGNRLYQFKYRQGYPAVEPAQNTTFLYLTNKYSGYTTQCVVQNTSVNSVKGVQDYNVIQLPTSTSSTSNVAASIGLPLNPQTWNPLGQLCYSNGRPFIVGIYDFRQKYQGTVTMRAEIVSGRVVFDYAYPSATLFSNVATTVEFQLEQFFNGTQAVITSFIINARPYWVTQISGLSANTMTFTANNRVFYDQTAGKVFSKFNSPTGILTLNDSVGTTTPALTVCTSADEFTMVSTSTQFIDTDLKYQPLKYTKSTFVTNLNWTNTSQQYLTFEWLDSSGVMTAVPFSAGNYTFTLSKGANTTAYLLIRLKHCLFPQNDDAFISSTEFTTNSATHPQRVQVLPLNIRVTECAKETFAPLTTLMEIYVQKNTVTNPTSVTLMADTTSALYGSPSLADPLCAVKEWFISTTTTTTKITSADPLYDKFNVAMTSEMGPLTINSQEAPSEQTVSYQFRVQVLLRGTAADLILNVLHSKPASVKVYLGCYDLAYLSVRQLTTVTNPNFLSLTGTSPFIIKMLYRDTTAGTTGTIALDQMIEFFSDQPGCSVYSLTAYTDAQKTTQTTTAGTYLDINPTVRDMTTGAMVLSLKYTIGQTPIPTNVFIEAKTNPQIKAALTAQIQMEFSACSAVQPVLASGVSSRFFSLTQEDTTQTIDVTPLFTGLNTASCGGISYIVAPTPSNMAGTVTEVSITGSILSVQTTTRKSVIFYVSAFHSDFSTLFASLAVTVEVKSICESETLTQLSPLAIKIQQNKMSNSAYQTEVICFQQIQILWSAPLNSLCAVSKWWLVNADGTNLTSADPNYSRFLQGSRSQPNEALIINTQNSNNLEITFEIKIRSDLRAPDLPLSWSHSNLATVIVTLGCYEQTIINAVVQTSHSMTDFISFTSNILKIVTYKKATLEQKSFKLNDILVFTTDIAGCGPHRIQSFSDAARTIITTDSSATRLKGHTLVKDLATNAFDPVIEYTQSIAQPPLLYLRLTTDVNHLQTTPAILDLTVDLTACEHQPVAVNQSISEFNTTQDQDAITINASNFFTLNPGHSQCDGYDFWLATDTTGATAASPLGASLTGPNLRIDSAVPGNYDFFVIVKSQTSLLHASKQVMINVKNYCLTQDINVSSSTPLTISMQKNKNNLTDMVFTLKTTQELIGLWNTPANVSCAISRWFLSDSSSETQLPATDPIYTRFQQPSPDPIDDLRVNVEYSGWTSLVSSFKIQIKVGTGNYEVLYPSPLSITVTLNCKEETLGQMLTLKNGIQVQWFKSWDSATGSLYFRVPRVTDKILALEINLAEIFTLTPDFTWCQTTVIGLTSSAFDETMPAISATANSYLKMQPTLRLDDQTLNPVIVARYGSNTASPDSLYLKIKADDSSTSVKTLSVHYEVCSASDPYRRSEFPFNKGTIVEGSPVYSLDPTTFFYTDFPQQCYASIYSISNTNSALYPNRTFPVSLDPQTNQILITTNIFGEFYFDLNHHALHSSSQIARQRAYVTILNVCSTETMPAVQPLVNLTVQRNQLFNGSSVVTAIAVKDIQNLFRPPRNETCNIAGWYLTTLSSDEQINQYDSTAVRMMQTGRIIGMDDLLVDTTLGFESLVLRFRLWTYLRSTLLPSRQKNPYFVSISLEFTCSDERLEQFWLPLKDGGHFNLISANETAVRMLYPRTKTFVRSQVDLSQILNLRSTFKGCNVERVRAFYDLEYKRLAVNGSIFLQENSTWMDTTSGLIAPVIEVKYDSYSQELPTLFLQASKVLNSTTTFTKNHIVTFEFCADQPLSLVRLQRVQVTLGDKPVIVDPSKLFVVNLQYPQHCLGEFEFFTSQSSDLITSPPFKQHKIENGLLVMEASQYGVQFFYLIGRYLPSGKFTSIPFQINVKNRLPAFIAPLMNIHSINVTVDHDGQLKEDSFYKYTSPKLRDPDGHQLTMQFLGTFGKDFIKIKSSNLNDSFTIIVDRDKVKESDSFSVIVQYGDEINEFAGQQEIQFEIVFKKIKTSTQQNYTSSFNQTSYSNQSQQGINTTNSSNLFGNSTSSADNSTIPDIQAQSDKSNSDDNSTFQDNSTADANETADANGTRESTQMSSGSSKSRSTSSVSRGKGFVFNLGTRKENVTNQDTLSQKLTEDQDQDNVKPPEPIRVNKMVLDSKGIFTISISGDVDWPQSIHSLFNRTQELRSQNLTSAEIRNNLKRNLKGSLGKPPAGIEEILSFIIEGATSMEKNEINPDKLMIDTLSDNSIAIKIAFENPEQLSMSDQSIQDRLIVILTQPLVGKNGLKMSTQGFDLINGKLQAIRDIQPMVNTDSTQIQTLDSVSSGIFNIGVVMMVGQFLMTSILSTSLSFFWNLINSQINFVYVPLLSVNSPGQVSLYFDVLIYVCTFDPIPMDIIYLVFPIWNFDKVSLENNVGVFSRIGMEDRNIIGVLGSLILFIFIFFISQAIYQILRPFRPYSHRVRKVIKYVSIESAYRSVIIRFFLQTYFDLLLGGYLNSENDYLLDDSSNWGIKGNLTTSDQFAVVLGNIIFIGCFLFPFVVMLILDVQYRFGIRTQQQISKYDYFYDSLYAGLKTNMPGPLNYFCLYIIRKEIFSTIVYFFSEPEWALFQIVSNLLLSILFCAYLCHFKPFVKQEDNRMQLLNEVSFHCLSVLYFCYTDYNPNPQIKIQCGWVMILLVLGNLVWPNFTFMIRGVSLDFFRICKKQQQKFRKKRSTSAFEKARLKFIKKKKMKLKEEFKPKNEKEDKTIPRRNQVVPKQMYPQLKANVYKILKKKKEEIMKIKRLNKPQKEMAKKKKKELSLIMEESNEYKKDLSEIDYEYFNI